MTYGSAAGVAAYTPRYLNESAAFDAETRPTLTQVTTWLDEVSSIIDHAAGAASIDVNDSNLSGMLDAFTNAQVAELVLGVNGAGRYGPTENRGSSLGSWFKVVTKEATDFFKANSTESNHVGVTKFTRQDSFSG